MRETSLFTSFFQKMFHSLSPWDVHNLNNFHLDVHLLKCSLKRQVWQVAVKSRNELREKKPKPQQFWLTLKRGLKNDELGKYYAF